MVNELTAEQYKATRTERMRDISDVEGLDNDYPATNIWEYVKELVIAGVLPRYVWDNQVVEMLSRNNDDTFDHILLPTNEENIFVTIIIDLEMEEILGHYVLDVNAG
jgi:translation initiation factor RLI1